MIRPRLHHHPTLLQVRSMVISRADLISRKVSKLKLNVLLVEFHRVELSQYHPSEAMTLAADSFIFNTNRMSMKLVTDQPLVSRRITTKKSSLQQ